MHEMKVSSRGNAVERGTEVWGAGVPGSGGVTSLSSLPPKISKRHSWGLSKKVKTNIQFCQECGIVKDHLWDREATEQEKNCQYIEPKISLAQKNKKDLSKICNCAIKAPMHTVGYHEALKAAL